MSYRRTALAFGGATLAVIGASSSTPAAAQTLTRNYQNCTAITGQLTQGILLERQVTGECGVVGYFEPGSQISVDGNNLPTRTYTVPPRGYDAKAIYGQQAIQQPNVPPAPGSYGQQGGYGPQGGYKTVPVGKQYPVYNDQGQIIGTTICNIRPSCQILVP